MTASQREMARHALGFPNKKNTSNRNHYCIDPGGDGHDEWLDLVSHRLAVKRNTRAIYDGDDTFHLTLKGALMVRESKEHLSREDAERMRKLEVAR